MNAEEKQVEPTVVSHNEADPLPDGRVPSSTGWPSIKIKTPGPEMSDPRGAESHPTPQGMRRDEDIFPVIERNEVSGPVQSDD